MGAHSLDPELVAGIVDRISRELRDAMSGIALPAQASETPAALPEAASAVRRAGSQTEMLRALIQGAASCGARAALFVVRGEQVEGWEGVGFEDEPTLAGVLRGLRLSRELPAVEALFQTQQTVHAVMGGEFVVPDFGQTVRGEAVLVPVVVHGKLVGVLYGDPASGDAPFDRRALEVLAEMAGLAVERLTLAHTTAQPAAVAPVRPAPVVASPAPSAVHGSGPVAAPSPHVSAPVAAPMAAAPPHSAPAPHEAPPAAMDRPSVEWSKVFSAPRGAAEIEDARRYARLLMEEIQLYHGDKVEEGRAQRDLAARLADEINKARQLYERRTDARVRQTGDYFEEALVSVLGGGDPHLLGVREGQPS